MMLQVVLLLCVETSNVRISKLCTYECSVRKYPQQEESERVILETFLGF